uniref:Uncharacterized protein n=1 Tax=Pinctada fucata TaxID=50426 RepID=A0A194ALE0_PINFU
MKGFIILCLLVIISCAHALPKRFLSDGPLTVTGNCLRNSACSGCNGPVSIGDQKFCCRNCHGGVTLTISSHSTCYCANH